MIKKITIPRYSIEALIKLLEINGKNSKLAAKTALENLLAASDNEETLIPEFEVLYEDIILELNQHIEDEVDCQRIIDKFDNIIDCTMKMTMEMYVKENKDERR